MLISIALDKMEGLEKASKLMLRARTCRRMATGKVRLASAWHLVKPKRDGNDSQQCPLNTPVMSRHTPCPSLRI